MFVIPPVILCCILSCCLVLIVWHITTAITFHANHHQDHSVDSWPKERNQMFSIPWTCKSPGYSLSSHQCYFSKPFWQPWLIFGVDLPPLPKKNRVHIYYIYIFIYLFVYLFTHKNIYMICLIYVHICVWGSLSIHLPYLIINIKYIEGAVKFPHVSSMVFGRYRGAAVKVSAWQ